MPADRFVSLADEASLRRDYHPNLGVQLMLCFKRLLRRFVYRREWRYFLYAGFASVFAALATRGDYFFNIEGTMAGTFVLAFLSIWVGALNSIQTVCREKNGIRHEREAGMYLAAYVIANMLYQALLCLAEAFVIFCAYLICGVSFPTSGAVTPWFHLDLLITLFLMIFASDMLAFLISCIVNNTTLAMTVLPIFLVLEMVFSGVFVGLLPEFSKVAQKFSIASRGIEAINSEADYNSLPMEMTWESIAALRDRSFGGKTTLADVLSLLSKENEVYHSVNVVRNTKVGAVLTIEEVMEQLLNNPKFEPLRRYEVMSLFEIGELLKMIHETGLLDSMKHYTVGTNISIGEIIDWLATNPKLEYVRQVEFGNETTFGQIIDFFGEDELKEFVQKKTAEVIKSDRYVKSGPHVAKRWLYLGLFAVAYAAASLLVLRIVCKRRR